jgi:hypothetical protein
MARVIRRRGWKALKGGGAIRTDDPADFVDIEIEEIELRKGAGQMNKDEIYELMEKRQAELGSDWPSDDPVWAGLYEAYKQAPVAEPAPVEKSAQPGDRAWRVIEKRAHALMAEAEESGVTLSEAAAIETVCSADPELYVRYRSELLAG